MPKNVGWVADNAEDGKLEDRIKVERERCLADAGQQAGPQKSM